MAQIPYFNEDIAFHSKLGDNPNTDNGLSADELKAVSDAAALAIQNFINKYIVPTLNEDVAPDAFLKLMGGTMRGNINMSGKRITNLGAAVNDTDAISRAYLNSYVMRISQGGTGARTAEDARKNLGAAPEKHTHSGEDIASPVPVSAGGTGAENGADGLKNLLAGGYMQLSAYQLMETLPEDLEAIPEGTVFFVPISELG